MATRCREDELVARSVEEAAEEMGLGPDETVDTLDAKIELVRRSMRRCEELREEEAGD